MRWVPLFLLIIFYMLLITGCLRRARLQSHMLQGLKQAQVPPQLPQDRTPHPCLLSPLPLYGHLLPDGSAGGRERWPGGLGTGSFMLGGGGTPTLVRSALLHRLSNQTCDRTDNSKRAFLEMWLEKFRLRGAEHHPHISQRGNGSLTARCGVTTANCGRARCMGRSHGKFLFFFFFF